MKLLWTAKVQGHTKKQSRNNIKKLFVEYQEALMEYQQTVNEHNEVLLEYQFALTEYHETLLNKRKLDGIPSRSMEYQETFMTYKKRQWIQRS